MPIVAVPDLVAIAVALAALLLIAAIALFARAVGGMFSVIPFVGGFLEEATVGVGLTVLSRMEGWLRTAVVDLGRPLWAAVIWILHFEDSVNQAIWNLLNHGYTIVQHYLPTAVDRAMTGALHWVMSLYDPGIAQLKDGEAALWSFVTPLQNAWDHYTVPNIQALWNAAGAVPGEIAAGVASAEAWAQTEIAREVAALAATIDPAVSALQSAVSAVPGEIAQGIGIAERFTSTAVGTVTTTVEGVTSEIQTQVLPQEATLAGVLAGLVAQVSTLTDYVTECGVPMCNDWRGLTSLFGQLRNAFAVAGVAEFVAAAAHDPEGTARTFAGAASGLEHGAAGLWDAVLAL